MYPREKLIRVECVEYVFLGYGVSVRIIYLAYCVIRFLGIELKKHRISVHSSCYFIYLVTVSK